jgi:oxygen-dependent protoporphyrinogen oxidase
MPRVVIVGAGVSGLAAAHRVKTLRPDVEVSVFEGSDRVGGLVDTERTDGFVIDIGPESIITDKPAGMDLIRELGLDAEVVRTKDPSRGALIVHDGKLVPIPAGFSLMAPTKMREFLESPILSWEGKVRASMDLVLPRGGSADDESLASFVERRFGKELLEKLAQPLAGGIYGADPAKLSLRATMPRFLEAEAEHRSVTLGLRARAKANRSEASSGARYGLFVNFRQGMRTLVEALEGSLEGFVTPRTQVRSIEIGTGGVTLETSRGTERADAVILAQNAKSQAALLKSIDAELASELSGIEHGSAGIVTFAWRREDVPHPLAANGFVVPTVEKRAILASTFLSEKWPGRAPDGWVLLRVFVREDRLGERVEELIEVARGELRSLLGITKAPELVRAHQWRGVMPHYYVGHLDRVRRVDSRLAAFPRLALAGNSLRGVGIPDAIRAGDLAARSALEAL